MKYIVLTILGLIAFSGCAHDSRVADMRYGEVPVYNGFDETIPVYMRTSADGSWEQVPVWMRGGAQRVERMASNDVHEGEAVHLMNAKVQKVDSDYNFWVGPSMAESVPVVLNREKINLDPEERVEVREGQSLAIMGVWKKTSDSVKDLKMTEAEQREFLNNTYFLSASSVRGAAGTQAE